MAPGQPLVSVVIPNWNGKHFLKDCLQAVREQSYPNFEVILVDNGSTDGSADFVRKEFPEVRLVSHRENLGFAEGTNTGIRAASGGWIATLNNDTIADRDWLNESVKATAWGKRIGMVACRLVLMSDPQILNSVGIRFNFSGRAWDIGFGAPVEGDFTKRLDVFGPSSGAALYSSEMLKEIGLLDSSFFAYFEDFDLAWRARLRGWRCVYCPTSAVKHHFSGTSKPRSAFVISHCQKNRITVMIRYYPFRYLLLGAPVVAGEFALGLARKVLTGGNPSFDGLMGGLRNWKDSVEKRKRAAASAVVSPGSLFHLYGRGAHYSSIAEGELP